MRIEDDESPRFSVLARHLIQRTVTGLDTYIHISFHGFLISVWDTLQKNSLDIGTEFWYRHLLHVSVSYLTLSCLPPAEVGASKFTFKFLARIVHNRAGRPVRTVLYGGET